MEAAEITHKIFQLTASRRGWQYSESVYLLLSVFQLTASRRGWRITDTRQRETWHFNSQPHEEADSFLLVCRKLRIISTHSLTKRLTSSCHVLFSSVYISTHSLTKRLTIPDSSGRNSSLFQLTASRRGWLVEAAAVCSVSDFNSQPHEEADDAFGFHN